MEAQGSRRLAGRLGDHARSNAIAYIALCFAVGGGTAFAADTVFSEDIVNGEVKSADIGGGEVNTSDIANGAVTGAKIPNESIGHVDLKAGAVRGSEIANGSVGTLEIADDAVSTAKIATGAVDSDEIATNGVGASELGAVVQRPGTGISVPGGTAENGAYNVGTAAASCQADEQLLFGTGQWSPGDNAANNSELWIAETRIGQSVVSIDGGNDSGTAYTLTAVAHCLG